MLLFCVDIGNTNIVLGIFEDGAMLNHWRIRTERDMTADELAVLINNLLIPAKLEMRQIGAVIISCVVPPLLSAFRDFCVRNLQKEPFDVGDDRQITDLLDRCHGRDFVLSHVARRRAHGAP